MDSLVQWTFASPVWLIAAFAVLFAGVLLVGLVRGRKPLMLAGGVLLLLCGGWLAASVLVETPQEWALADAEQIAASYGDADWEQFDTHIDDATRFEDWMTGPEIRAAARATHRTLGHESVTVADSTVERDAVGIQVTLEVVSLQGGPVPRLRTAWRFEYVQRGDVWTLDRITPLATEQIDPADIRSRIIRGARP